MKLLTALLVVSFGHAVAELETRPEAAASEPPAITEPILVPPIEPPETPEESLDSDPRSSPRTSEFQSDEIGLVLRTLARQARVSVYVDDSVTGTVTMRIDNKTPRETLDAICVVKDLIMEEQKGVLAIRSRIPPPPNDNGLLIAAVVLCGVFALVGWFAAGMLFQRLRSSAAGKPGSL